MSHAGAAGGAGGEAGGRAIDGPAEPVAQAGQEPGNEIPIPGGLHGHALLDTDSWAEQPYPALGVDTYEGSRRADPPPVRLWLVIALVLVGLGVVVAVPLVLFTGGMDRRAAAGTGDTGADIEAGDRTPSPGAPSLVAPTSAPGRSNDPGATSTGSRTTTPSGQAFTPLTLEAEAPGVTLDGSAQVTAYKGASNGSIVSKIGKWPGGAPGRITFNDVAIPSTGAYVITVYFVNLDGDSTHSAQISVSGANQIDESFTAGTACCASKALPAITLAAGTHTITIGNQNGRAPSIDKIVISRP